MHLYMLTRGIKPKVDDYINDLLAQYFPYGTDKRWVQLSVRPIQLWEVVFPKDCLHDVLQTVLPIPAWKDWKPKKGLGPLRMAVKAKKIPEMDISFKENQMIRPIRKDVVAVYPFGIKEDKEWKVDPEPPEQFVKKGDEQL